jgi:glycerol-3-phosphate dehydrogenase (NAD(P)+)
MKFCVVGAGAWGTAFAVHLGRLGHPVSLVPRRAEQAAALQARRENADYLPGISLCTQVMVEHDLAKAAAGAAVVLLACPSQAIRETSARLKGAVGSDPVPALVLSLAKGLEIGNYLRPTEVMAQAMPGFPVGTLTGPTNAAEVARGLPAAMVLATTGNVPQVAEIQAAISSPTLRVYTSEDLAGAEFGGCLKNIYAIAVGVGDGLRSGDNAKAALLTRALAEMVRVGVALGARPETFYGLSGFGDLVATCYAGWSRNREFGFRIGEGMPVGEAASQGRSVVEGYRTAESFHGLCVARGIEAPILSEVHAILFRGKKPADALSALMSRGLKREASQPFLVF